MNGRRISVEVAYNNQSITRNIESFLTGLSFSDNLSGQADDLSLSLADREKNWMNSWKPKKGASIEASLVISGDWGSTKPSKRKIGYFEIDQLDISGLPNKVDVKSTSIPQSSSLRGTKKTKAWEKTNLKKVAQDIASKNGVKLNFKTSENPEYDRVEQQKETDLVFLNRICTEAGFSLKVANKKINILDDAELEKKDIVDTINSSDKRIKSYSGKDGLKNSYKSCKISYTIKQVESTTGKSTKSTKSKETAKKSQKEKSKQVNKTYTYTFTPPHPIQTDRILEVKEEVNSKAAAIKLAKNKLREVNKETTTFSLKLAGYAHYYAGQTIKLKGWGFFDGKYMITSFGFSAGNGSETSLELRKCLGGY